eukprot:sb/3473163/
MKLIVCLVLIGACMAYEAEKRDIILGMPGGIYPANLKDPEAQEAVKQALGEFKTRASGSGLMSSQDVILVGDVVDVKTQVVAGQKYIITIKLGLTSNKACVEKANHGFVSTENCSDTENLGTHSVEVISQPWMEAKYSFGDFEDVDGPKLASYWN